MVVCEDAGLTGGGVEGEDPAVLVVGGAGEDHGFFAVVGPDGLEQLDVAVLRRAGARAGGAAPSVEVSVRWVAAGGVTFWP